MYLVLVGYAVRNAIEIDPLQVDVGQKKRSVLGRSKGSFEGRSNMRSRGPL